MNKITVELHNGDAITCHKILFCNDKILCITFNEGGRITPEEVKIVDINLIKAQ